MSVGAADIPTVTQIEWWYYLLAVLGALALLVKYTAQGIRGIYRWAKRLDEGLSTMQVLRQNHLPHIEFYLAKICDKLDIQYVPMEANIEAHKDGDSNRDRED